MKKKILALCSGGFDSILLLHTVRDNNPDCEIHTLFFDYGQNSYELERKCVVKASENLCCKFHEVKLPKFDWTSGEFYTPTFSGDGQYLEMRNLVFISYALSMCESLGLNYLYMATLKSLSYYDTSDDFLSKVKGIAFDKGIFLETPFSLFEKEELSALALYNGIHRDDFFTCDTPVGNKPCGSCPDCLVIESIFEMLDKDFFYTG